MIKGDNDLRTYDEFHGEIRINDIGKKLRRIVENEKGHFKILTGYGSSTGVSKSKIAALKSLSKMKKEGKIKGYLPGDILTSCRIDSIYNEDKIKYYTYIKNDVDFGNDGIIFVFI